MTKYNEDSIQVLQGLEGILRKPAMYIGELGDHAIFHLLRETVENSSDEALAGYNDYIGVKVIGVTNQEFVVVDRGRGIPVGTHKKTKVSTLTSIFTSLHSGGKFDDKSYKASRGTHGVGLSALTALSEFVEVYTCRDEVWWYQRFSNLKPEADVEQCSFPAKLVKDLGASRTKGTVIYWKPNYKVLGKTAKIDDDTIDSWLYDIAYLNTKLKVVLKTEGLEETYYNKGGPKEFLANIVEDLEVEIIGKPFVFEDERLTLAIQWSNYDEEDGIVSYVNNSHTEFGGTHILGLHDVLSKTFKAQSLAKHNYTAQDLRQGVVGFINYKLSGAEFSSQTKERLVTNKAKVEVPELLSTPLTTWLNQNKSTVRAILDRATSIHTAKEQARELTKAASNIKQSRKSLLPGKLMGSHHSTPVNQRELFIVEGLSAAGTVRKARDSRHQEVLSLRGKPLNVAKANLKRVLENKEVVDILSSIGFSETDFKALAQGKRVAPSYRIGKIMMLSDSDVDGAHIAQLLITVFFMLCPDLIQKGMLYQVNAPLFVASYKENKWYANTLVELKKNCHKNSVITRLKGWGEADWKDMQNFAFNENRSLTQITMVKGKEAQLFMKIVGEDSATRKEILGID